MPARRQPSGPSQVRATRFTEDEWAAVESAADSLSITTSELIRQAVGQYLERRN